MIAEMLRLVGRVEETAPLTFTASSAGGHVLHAPIRLYSMPGHWGGVSASVASVRGLMYKRGTGGGGTARAGPSPATAGQSRASGKQASGSSFFSAGSPQPSMPR